MVQLRLEDTVTLTEVTMSPKLEDMVTPMGEVTVMPMVEVTVPPKLEDMVTLMEEVTVTPMEKEVMVTLTEEVTAMTTVEATEGDTTGPRIQDIAAQVQWDSTRRYCLPYCVYARFCLSSHKFLSLLYLFVFR